MITTAELDRFISFRNRIFMLISAVVAEDEHHKSYAGALSIHFPNFFSEGNSDAYSIQLDGYVLGPHRHYQWDGKTFNAALDKAEKDLNEWCNLTNQRGEDE